MFSFYFENLCGLLPLLFFCGLEKKQVLFLSLSVSDLLILSTSVPSILGSPSPSYCHLKHSAPVYDSRN